MIIDSLTIAGLLTFVAVSAFLILVSRDAAKRGEFRPGHGTPGKILSD